MLTKILTKIFSMIVAAAMPGLIITAPVPDVSPMAVEPDPSFVPVLRFVVSSDSHIDNFGDNGCLKLMKMIETGYASAEADSSYGKLDAAVMVGDITNNGYKESFAAVDACVKHVLRDGTVFLGVAAKNHDGYQGRVSRGYISYITGQPADFHNVINGYHFIGLSASADGITRYSLDQLIWLDRQLKQATKDDPSKPVFVFQHEHIKNTVYGSLPEDGWGIPILTPILSKYPQVVDISGHSHYPANDPRAIWQGKFTALNDGGLSYYEFTVDGAKSQHPESSNNMAHMLLVEVDANNRVKVRVCDLTADAVMAEYLIDNVTEPVKTKYAPETRRAAAQAPVFAGTPEVSVNGTDVTVSSAPATPGNEDAVFIYRLEIVDAAGKTVASAKKLGDYYKNPVSGEVSMTVNGLAAGSYTAKLTAESAWGTRSQPVCADFTVG